LQAYIFKDYWEDIGTIKSFYEANLALAEEVSFIIMTLDILELNSIPFFYLPCDRKGI
jgi:ADP-glucose pyrophosphorylase